MRDPASGSRARQASGPLERQASRPLERQASGPLERQASGPLERRMELWWRREAGVGPSDPVIVAVSGGVDSLVLLDLTLAVRGAPEGTTVAAHFDHAIRPESADDARAVSGICSALRVELEMERAPSVPSGETEARRMRYAFLRRTAARRGAVAVLTAHHADDQVETILFRILRGTGVRGLTGIPARRPGGWEIPGTGGRSGHFLRPLLETKRSELEAHARTRGLHPLPDATNLDPGPSRNRLRLEVLPRIEAVHPGAREAILRLGRNAGRMGDALDALLDPLYADIHARVGARGASFDRDAFLNLVPAVQVELLRHLGEGVGIRLDEAGTVRALEFIRAGPVGAGIDLTGGARLTRASGRIALQRPTGG